MEADSIGGKTPQSPTLSGQDITESDFTVYYISRLSHANLQSSKAPKASIYSISYIYYILLQASIYSISYIYYILLQGARNVSLVTLSVYCFVEENPLLSALDGHNSLARNCFYPPPTTTNLGNCLETTTHIQIHCYSKDGKIGLTSK